VEGIKLENCSSMNPTKPCGGGIATTIHIGNS
jgi:hypothetical protein